MAYITKEDVKAIRLELKAAFPKMKFAVRKEHYTSVCVSILKGPASLDSLLVGNEHRNMGLNHFYPGNYGEHKGLVEKISEIMHNAPGRAGGTVYFDESDSMTDYFHTAFYVNMEIGKWNKPFESIGA